MRILLIGEYSRLHNSLKEGLLANGHDVLLVNSGDAFKNYPADYSIKPRFSETFLGNVLRQLISKIFRFDTAKIEMGLRFYKLLPLLKGFDYVQLINERPIQTVAWVELYLLKKIMQQNPNVYLLSCGVDYPVVQHLLAKKEPYSILNPYFEGNPKAKAELRFVWEYTTKSHAKIHHYLQHHIRGIIASDLDYVNPNADQPNYLGLIPNPVNIDTIPYSEPKLTDRIVIFLGINTGTQYTKGIVFFEKALAIIQAQYPDKVTIQITRNLPYAAYRSKIEACHILLDQVYALDQGYNALEAMAQGKVVFTGAEKCFEDYYNLKEKVALNALPDVAYLVEQLTYLIENPEELIAIGKRARTFIETHHNYRTLAQKYLSVWEEHAV